MRARTETGYVVPVDKIINETTISWNGVISTDVEILCPECGSTLFQRSRDSDMLEPDATWYECDDCHYQTEPE